MRLLLISNSTMPNEAYLDYPKFEIQKFLGEEVKKVVFIPYAGVTVSYSEFNAKVRERFEEVGYEMLAVDEADDAVAAVEEAEAIVVGGGNTFRLVDQLYENNLIEAIRKKVLNDTPFIGWSAGSNVACPTLSTTNDMPVIEPKSFKTLNLIPFQINPHYLDANPDGHAGETREDRIMEFLELNQTKTVIGLREGTMLRIEDNAMRLVGERNARIFTHGQTPFELTADDNFSHFLELNFDI